MANKPELTCTLLGDGSSDRVLEHPIRWLLRDLCRNVAVQFEWAELSKLPKPPRDLSERLSAAVDLYPAEILFVHRDAEREGREARVLEIEEAARNALGDNCAPFVCVVPVRMTEAWFIFDERAIRQAAGNPSGSMPLQMPTLQNIEHEPDPKSILEQLLIEATGLGSHRKRRFRSSSAFHRLAQLTDNYAPLRELSAFCAFEADLIRKLSDGGWIRN